MQVLSDAGIEELATLYAGQEFETRATPSVGCEVHNSEDDVSNCGNQWQDVVITIRSSADKAPNETTADDPTALHQALVGSVSDALKTTTLEADLTAVEDDYTCMIARAKSSDAGVVGRCFFTTLNFRVYAAPGKV